MGTPVESDVDLGTLDRDQRDRLWTWLLHEGTLFNARQQLFAISEAMLLAAYATMVGASHADRRVLTWMLGVGVVSCLMWLYANWHQIERSIKPIRSLLEPHVPEWRAIRAVGSGRLRVTTVMGLLFPGMIALLWLALLSFHLEGAA